MASSPVLKPQHQPAQLELLRHKKARRIKRPQKQRIYVIYLGATDFALPAAIFYSLTSGVQKLYRKIWISYVNNICNGKKFCYDI